MNKRHPTFCSRPATDRDLTPDGMVLPCCELQTEKSYSPKDFQALHEALSKGEKHPHCRICWEKEELGQASARLGSQKPEDTKPEIKRLNINLSNFCNLKCRMCDSVSSHLWIEDEKSLRMDPQIKKIRPEPVPGVERPFESREQLHSWLGEMDLQNLQQIKFGGGEPFMQKLFPDLLKYFTDRKLTELRVLVHTNGTVINPQAISLLEKFKEVYFCLSIEAVGPMYRYIRGGEKFTTAHIEANLREIKEKTSFKLLQHSAIPAFGVFGIGELIAWLIENGCYKAEQLSDERITFLPVYEPRYLSPEVLPLSFRVRALEKSLSDLENKNYNSLEFRSLIERLLVINKESSQELADQFKLFATKLDEIRGENLLHVEPEFAEIF